jgi:NAD(P)-dependent dehydrogenase (short-subunit alcohol dehydrogenase family)
MRVLVTGATSMIGAGTVRETAAPWSRGTCHAAWRIRASCKSLSW